jgi:hypothetical protein
VAKTNIAIGFSEAIPGFYDKIWLPFKDNIATIFFSAPREFGVNNARGVYTKREALAEILKMRTEKPALDCNLLLNCACIGRHLTADDEFRIKCLLDRLYEMNCFTSISVSNAWYLRHVLKWKSERKTDIRIHASVIWDIKSVDEMLNIFWRYGDNCIDVVNLSRRVVHDLPLLEEFKESFPHIKTKLIVNEWCMHNCPEQIAHGNYLSHWGEYHPKDKAYIGERMVNDQIQFCIYDKANFWRFLCGKGIPPDGLHYYGDLVDYWKIGSRSKDPAIMAELCDAYIHQKPKDVYFLFRTSHGGMSLPADENERDAKKFKDVFLPERWFKKRIECDNRCYKCHFCERIFQELAPTSLGED